MKISSRPRVLKFQVENKSYTNVNFARTYAEQLANETGKEVSLYQTMNGVKSFELFVIKPNNRLTVIDS